MAVYALDRPSMIAGTDFVICHRDDGTLWGFGSNAKGQLGLGSVASVTEWTQLPITNVARIFHGCQNTNVQYCVFALLENGDLYSTGYNTTARSFLGYASANTTTFTKVPITRVVCVACTEYGTAFIRTNGTVQYTGHNIRVGGLTGDTYQTVITEANPDLVGIKSACPSFNSGYMCYLDNNGEWYHTVKNTNVTNATAISGNLFKGLKTDIVKMACSKDAGTVFAQTTDGKLYGWGENSYGEIGIGNTTDQATWVEIPIDNVKQFALGVQFSLVLKNDGTVWGTGRNNTYQLGLGITDTVTSFRQLNVRPTHSIQAGQATAFYRYQDNVTELSYV